MSKPAPSVALSDADDHRGNPAALMNVTEPVPR
jgi:hypothetical protein